MRTVTVAQWDQADVYCNSNSLFLIVKKRERKTIYNRPSEQIFFCSNTVPSMTYHDDNGRDSWFTDIRIARSITIYECCILLSTNSLIVSKKLVFQVKFAPSPSLCFAHVHPFCLDESPLNVIRKQPCFSGLNLSHIHVDTHHYHYYITFPHKPLSKFWMALTRK